MVATEGAAEVMVAAVGTAAVAVMAAAKVAAGPAEEEAVNEDIRPHLIVTFSVRQTSFIT
jgi:hypothetical protein